jgi:cytochrome c peroxidase
MSAIRRGLAALLSGGGLLWMAVTLVTMFVTPGRAATPLGLEDSEVRRLVQHGPWPAPASRDPSNAVSGHPAAIALGHRLFFDPRLSASGAIACATCHVPARGWTDGRPRAAGLADVDRNTPTVLDVALHRWFSWDGRADSL